MVAACDRARVTAGRMSGRPGVAMAKANTAFRKKLAAVMTVTPMMAATRTGPGNAWKDFPWKT